LETIALESERLTGTLTPVAGFPAVSVTANG